jgi:hypothetical protein
MSTNQSYAGAAARYNVVPILLTERNICSNSNLNIEIMKNKPLDLEKRAITSGVKRTLNGLYGMDIDSELTVNYLDSKKESLEYIPLTPALSDHVSFVGVEIPSEGLLSSIKEIKDEMVVNRTRIAALEGRFAALEDKNLIEKVLVANQDLNSSESLESQLPELFRDSMTYLRNKRVDECHFILDVDSLEIKMRKYESLHNHLKMLRPEIRAKVLGSNRNGDEFMNQIEIFLKSKSDSLALAPLSNEEIAEIDEWWDL